MVQAVIKTRTGTKEDGHKLPSMERERTLASVMDHAINQAKEVARCYAGIQEDMTKLEDRIDALNRYGVKRVTLEV